MKIASSDIPDNKRVVIALTYIFGIGLSTARKMLKDLKIDENIRAKDLTPEQVNGLQGYIANSLTTEGELRREVAQNISRLIRISCYRGIRHRSGLPVRGQKSRNKGGKRRDRRKKKIVA